MPLCKGYKQLCYSAYSGMLVLLVLLLLLGG